MLLESSNIHYIIVTLNNELNKLNDWLGANRLSIHLSRPHCIVFHQARRKTNKHVLSIGYLNNVVVNHHQE